MMNSSSPLLSTTNYLSEEWQNSESFPGVKFAVRRLSLGGRLTLNERLRDLLQKYEFLQAGDITEKNEAALADLLVRRLYLEWGLSAVQGLKIDGSDPSIELLIERGPEALSDEIVASIRTSLELSEDERKNS